MKNRPIALIILDGYGINPAKEGNAVEAAHKPNLDKLTKENPSTIIRTSGMDVGLPEGQMGNSEVGHTNIGAGRIVYQELTRITKSIQDADFYDKKEFNDAIDNCLKNGTKLHLFGLLSDGGVHSHNTHLYALLELAKRRDLKDVYVHCFFDGRDVAPDSALGFVQELEDKLKEIGVGQIATIMGRYYAMDRDNRWERVELAYNALVMGEGRYAHSAVEGVKASYQEGIMDEFVVPTVILKNPAQNGVNIGPDNQMDKHPTATIEAGDSIIFFNFRPDRAREITRSFVDPDFTGFERKKGFFPVHYVCMTQYDKTMPNVEVAFKPESLDNTFGEYISKKASNSSE